MNPNPAHLPTEIDHTIDRALSTLRDTRPRAGLNNRILSSLDHRTSERATNPATNPDGLPFHGFIVKGWGIVRGSARGNADATTRLAFPTKASAAAIAVIAIAAIIAFHHHTASTELASAPHSSGAPVNQVPQVSTLRPGIESPRTLVESTARHPEQSAAKRRTAVFENCSDHPHTGCPIHGGTAVVSGEAGTPTDLDAQALTDLHTASYPAPPLPLTTEEKLFIRMTRYGNATQLAELDPVVRAKHDDDEAAAFKAFFPEPPPLKQPLGDTNEPAASHD